MVVIAGCSIYCETGKGGNSSFDTWFDVGSPVPPIFSATLLRSITLFASTFSTDVDVRSVIVDPQ